MCGINGIFNYAGVAAPVSEALLATMNRSIAHRGPDGEGVWSDPARGIWLGHRRLSILDLSDNGRQPMHGPDGTVISYNGEVYNFRELAATLGGEALRSGTDTEVLLRLFHRDGPRCLESLNGMFAFAAWDPRDGRLFLARDRLGIKPLYYTLQGGLFAFSSDLRALLLLPWVRRELDEPALHHFLTFNSLPAPLTLFRGIEKCPPGHSMVVGPRGIERNSAYWQIRYDQPVPDDEEGLCREVLGGLRRSVRYQMVSDVPVGAFLSGGVDSSAVVALMSEVSQGPVRTFSVGFADAPAYDERRYAADVARRFGTEHHERVVEREELVELLPRVANIAVDPLADPTSIPIYFISELARRTDTKVILTGDGADELFAGYRGWLRYQRLHPWYRRLAALPRPLRAAAGGIGRRTLAEESIGRELLQRAAAGQQFFWGGAGGFRESLKQSILSPAFRARIAPLDGHAYIAGRRRQFEALVPPARRGSVVDWMVYSGLTDPVPNVYLHRGDDLGMAHSVELRVPFLDHHFVTLGTSIPGEWKLRDGEPKYILKRALAPVLPREVLYRRKQGFNVPLREWMLTTIVDHIERGAADFCRLTGLFDADGIGRLVASARGGAVNLAPSLWNVFFLMSWFDQWMLRPAAPVGPAATGTEG
jgi:asparagine synthase (glutamine-hydrolysing)